MNARILVIEDNAKNLKLVRDVLQHVGYEVIEARTGEEGLQAAERCARPGADGPPTSRHRRHRDATEAAQARPTRHAGGGSDGVRDA